MGKVEIDPELQLRINRTKAQDDVAGVVAIAFELAEKLAALENEHAGCAARLEAAEAAHAGCAARIASLSAQVQGLTPQ